MTPRWKLDATAAEIEAVASIDERLTRLREARDVEARELAERRNRIISRAGTRGRYRRKIAATGEKP